ncbi:hypothetical protein WJX84_000288 [Apatococcus fuscideae]|uniref:Uncharacterized protein n=1 Tax=Apatococcus fuscideae TaxID=2026836 RepID=A0AAW1TFG7_9CHLO
METPSARKIGLSRAYGYLQEANSYYQALFHDVAAKMNAPRHRLTMLSKGCAIAAASWTSKALASISLCTEQSTMSGGQL